MGFRGQVPPSTGLAQDGAADGQSWQWSDADGQYVPYTPAGGGGVPVSQTIPITDANVTTYQLTQQPAAMLAVLLNGLEQRPSDWTVTGTTLDVTQLLRAVGDTLQADYEV